MPRDIKGYAEGIEEAVLIGGGLLGLEAGHALIKLGKRVTVVEFFPRLLPRQLDTDGAQRLQRKMEGMGVRLSPGGQNRVHLGGSARQGGLAGWG